jgi:hypothetical protein
LTDADKAGLPESVAEVEAKTPRFTPDQMIACDECRRQNPPTRPTCLYCGAPLANTSISQETRPDPTIAVLPPETTEGFSVVLRPAPLTDSTIAELATLLHLQIEDLRGLKRAGNPKPIARFATVEQASKFSETVAGLGLEADTIADSLFKPEAENRKIRSLEFSDNEISGTASSGGGRVSSRWDEVILIVTGRILVNRLEVEERRKRGRQQPLDTRELFSDESILDLYSQSNTAAWRISANSFDFSCLDPAKGMTTFENFSALVKVIRDRAPKVEVNTSYIELRNLLTGVWPLGKQTRHGNWRRSGAGKYDVSTITITDNEAQFNQYSRLLYHLKRKSESSE